MAKRDSEGTVELGLLTYRHLVRGLRDIVTGCCNCAHSSGKTRRGHRSTCPAGRAFRALRNANRAACTFRS